MNGWEQLKARLMEYWGLIKALARRGFYFRTALAVLAPIVGTAAALYVFWTALLLLLGLVLKYRIELAIFVGLPACGLYLILTHKGKKTTPPPPPKPLPIELVRARAEKTRRPLSMCMFTFVNDLRQHLPGLIQPFSLKSVENSAAPYTITADFITIFHFLIGKGECDVSRSIVGEILDSIIERHLQAQDLPLSIPAVYTSADGDTWPGLVVDRVYDMPLYYRVDLVITNEAEAAHLKRREASNLDDETPGTLYDDQL